MSEKTNKLLNLFSKILREPQLIMALRLEMMAKRFRNGGDRRGARGLLVKLWEQDGLTNSEIAELLDIRPSSVTAQVKELERRGYVERRADENDGRVSRIFLTEEGRSAKDKRSEQRNSYSEELFNNLTEEEQAQLAGLLEKLTSHWAENDNFDWLDMSHADWKGLSPEERRAIKEGMKDRMRQMKSDMRDEIKDATNWQKDFGFERRPGMGRPHGNFMDWVRGPRDMKDYPDWQDRHFEPAKPGDKKKKDDEKGWDEF
ncbi:MarR family winged helix-turn-helix transcriptional regulator [Lactococcus termiticola]|uniref:ArsR family transcriptional regulator n=1 Tax=Lactococcus termiticola TaxID=2169526 RepID=A0A2R5HJJ0_9LACT|nr:MarR family transcriptional regulator [Lactococcus termiticola]GBG96441.1 ArsR family transcriptional regulator [Lactococcus termiticola]